MYFSIVILSLRQQSPRDFVSIVNKIFKPKESCCFYGLYVILS